MKNNIDAGPVQQVKALEKVRKPGRPRAIPAELEPTVIDLYNLGYGYRAIAKTLRKDYYLNPDFSTVKRTLKRLGTLPHPGTISKSSPD
jgi:transposase-like protein